MIDLTANVEIVQCVMTPDGLVYDCQKAKNLIVDNGLNVIRSLIGGTSASYAQYFAVGTGTSAVTSSQTALASQVFRDNITQAVEGSKNTQIKYYLASGSANGNTIREIGLFTGSTGSNMIARVVLSSPIIKTSSVTVTFSWTISLSAI